MNRPGGNLLSSKPIKKHKREFANRNHKRLDKAGATSCHEMQTLLPSIIHIYKSFWSGWTQRLTNNMMFDTLLGYPTEPVSKTLLSNTVHTLPAIYREIKQELSLILTLCRLALIAWDYKGGCWSVVQQASTISPNF